MALVVAERSERYSSDFARTENFAHTGPISQENLRNQSSTSQHSSQGMGGSATDNSTGHTRSDDRQYGHSRLANRASPPVCGRPIFDALTPPDAHDRRGQTAAPESQPTSSPTIVSTAPFIRMLKWSMETKISIFQVICAVLGLGVAILFGVMALKQGNTSTQVGDRSLAISMWQACMQFPTSPATQSSKWCQENLNNTLENLESRSIKGTRPKFILEPDSMPRWILLPDDFDRSTCYMVCEGLKSLVEEIKTSTKNPTSGLPLTLEEYAAGIASGIARHARLYDLLGQVLCMSGAMICSFSTLVKHPRRVVISRQLPLAPRDVLMFGKHLALLGRAMTFSDVVSRNIVLRHPEEQQWVALLLYSSLIFFIANYATLRCYSTECWIFFEAMIHFILILPTSIETAIGCLLVYGPFYVFLWDYPKIFQWRMRRRRTALYFTSVVVFLSFTLVSWQGHLIVHAGSASIVPLCYIFEQSW